MSELDSPVSLIELQRIQQKSKIDSARSEKHLSPTIDTSSVNINAEQEVITPSIVRRGPRDLKKRRIVFKRLPTFGFESDYLHGAWWFVWGSFVSAIFPIPPLFDTYYPGSIFQIQQTPKPPDHQLSFFEVEASLWSLLAMGIFFTIGSLIYTRPHYSPPLPPLIKNSTIIKDDDVLAAWMFFIASIPSLGYVASFLASDLSSVIYWGMTFAAVLFVFLSGVFLYYSYQDIYADTCMLKKILSKFFGNKTWIVIHCENDILTALWICFWGTLAATVASAIYFIWQIWINGTGVEIYTYAVGAFDCILFTVGFAYFVSATYIKEEHIHSPRV